MKIEFGKLENADSTIDIKLELDCEICLPKNGTVMCNNLRWTYHISKKYINVLLSNHMLEFYGINMKDEESMNDVGRDHNIMEIIIDIVKNILYKYVAEFVSFAVSKKVSCPELENRNKNYVESVVEKNIQKLINLIFE